MNFHSGISNNNYDRVNWAALSTNPDAIRVDLETPVINWSIFNAFVQANPQNCLDINASIQTYPENWHRMVPVGTTVYLQTADHETFDCSIRFEEVGIGECVMRINNCQHKFNAEALYEWLMYHNTCPLCRTRVQI
jgi:hypothetical protein